MSRRQWCPMVVLAWIQMICQMRVGGSLLVSPSRSPLQFGIMQPSKTVTRSLSIQRGSLAGQSNYSPLSPSSSDLRVVQESSSHSQRQRRRRPMIQVPSSPHTLSQPNQVCREQRVCSLVFESHNSTISPCR